MILKEGVPQMAQFTQAAIRQTLLLLLEQTPLDKITVKMIVDACGISRNTFYYHYEDIPSLLQDVLRQELARVNSATATQENWRDQVLQLLNTIGAHRQVYDRIYHSSYRESLQNDIQHTIFQFSLSAVQSTGGQALGQPLQETIATFFSSAILGVCSQWLDSGADEPPEALIRRMSVFDGLLEQAVAKGIDLGK